MKQHDNLLRAEPFDEDERTDRHDEANTGISQFCERAEKNVRGLRMQSWYIFIFLTSIKPEPKSILVHEHFWNPSFLQVSPYPRIFLPQQPTDVTKVRSCNKFFTIVQQPPVGQDLLIYRGSLITLRHTTLDKIALDEWSARSRNLYLATHNIHPRRDSNSQSQQASGRKPMP